MMNISLFFTSHTENMEHVSSYRLPIYHIGKCTELSILVCVVHLQFPTSCPANEVVNMMLLQLEWRFFPLTIFSSTQTKSTWTIHICIFFDRYFESFFKGNVDFFSVKIFHGAAKINHKFYWYCNRLSWHVVEDKSCYVHKYMTIYLFIQVWVGKIVVNWLLVHKKVNILKVKYFWDFLVYFLNINKTFEFKRSIWRRLIWNLK